MKADTHDLAQKEDHNHGRQMVPSDLALRVKALESLLVEKGLVDPAALDALIDTYEHKIGPRNGARVVARAWVDPAYNERLLRRCHRCDRGTTLHPRTGRAYDGGRKYAAPISRLMLNRDSQSFLKSTTLASV